MNTGSWCKGLGLNLQHVTDVLQDIEVPPIDMRFQDAKKACADRVIFQMAPYHVIIGENNAHRRVVMPSNRLHGLDDWSWLVMQHGQGGDDVSGLNGNPTREQNDARNHEPYGGGMGDGCVGILGKG